MTADDVAARIVILAEQHGVPPDPEDLDEGTDHPARTAASQGVPGDEQKVNRLYIAAAGRGSLGPADAGPDSALAGQLRVRRLPLAMANPTPATATTGHSTTPNAARPTTPARYRTASGRRSVEATSSATSRATVTGAEMTWRNAPATADPAAALPSAAAAASSLASASVVVPPWEGGADAVLGTVAGCVPVVAARRGVVGIALTFSGRLASRMGGPGRRVNPIDRGHRADQLAHEVPSVRPAGRPAADEPRPPAARPERHPVPQPGR